MEKLSITAAQKNLINLVKSVTEENIEMLSSQLLMFGASRYRASHPSDFYFLQT